MSQHDKTHARKPDRQHDRAEHEESRWVMLDLLDRQIIDDEQHSVGKVDDVDFVADGPGPPRLSALLSGAQALGERMGGLVRRTMAGAARRMLIDPRAGARAVPWSDAAELGYVIELRAGIAELNLDPPSKCGCATTSSAPCPAAVMRAAELLGRPVRHRDGTDLGRVLDIRVTRTPGTPDPGAWHIDGIVVGAPLGVRAGRLRLRQRRRPAAAGRRVARARPPPALRPLGPARHPSHKCSSNSATGAGRTAPPKKGLTDAGWWTGPAIRADRNWRHPPPLRCDHPAASRLTTQ
jgi:sporulation protein YlmC with PRC-barrel domain